MKKLFAFLLLLPGFVLAQEIMTADDAIRIGLENNFDIRIARNQAAIAQNNRGFGTAGFLPTLDAAGNYQQRRSDQETNSPIGFGNSTSKAINGAISLNYTLFDGWQMFVNKSRFSELAKLGEFRARYQIENTVVAILAGYFNLVQQERLLEISVNARNVSEDRLRKARVRQEMGGVSATDFLNAQVSFNNDVAAVLNQELQVAIARKNLNILLGRDPGTPINAVKTIRVEANDFSLDELIRTAQARNSFLQVVRQDSIVAEKEVRLARSAFYPRLALNASYGYTDSETNREGTAANSFIPLNISSQSADAAIGLNLSFNLFNGLRDKIALENAKIQARNQALALMDVRNQIAGLVMEKYQTLQKQMELIALEEDNVVAAQRNLDLQQDRFNIGTTTSLEFRDAQVNLTRAQTTLVAAKYQARITRLEIEQLVGQFSY